MGLRGRTNFSDENFFFVTTSVVKHKPIFENTDFCDILVKNIKYYQHKYKFTILAYVMMPSHFHWIVEVNNKYGTISDIMRDVKKFTAWQIFDYLDKEGNNELNDFFKKEAKNFKGQTRKLWKQRFDEEVIRNQKMFWTKLKYIHNNPVKAGLVNKPEDYKYSSAGNYINSENSLLEIDTEYAGIELR